ncbi:MAG: hypothetical protein RBR88_07260, partial [Candidatus Saccharicenans sp.]|nr:hypothetical protein [Candidatus Saccharicenans sp.]
LLKKAPARGRAYLYCRNCDYVNYLSEEKAASPEPTRIPDPEQGSAGKTLDDQVLDENSSKDEKRD